MAKAGQATFSIESGPEGLKIDSNGKVSWTPKQRPVSVIEKVIIAARSGSDLERLQAFDLLVERAAGATASSARPKAKSAIAATAPSPRKSEVKVEETPVTPSLPPAPSVPSTPPAEAATVPLPEPTATADRPVKIDAACLEIPKGDFVLEPGLARKTMLLTQADTLTVLGPDGLTPENGFNLLALRRESLI